MPTADRAPQRRPGGRTAKVRQKVLDAAVELVAEQGVGAVGFGEVARVAGVHRSSLYRNWSDVESLVEDAILTRLAEQVPLHDTGDLETDLVDFLCALAEALSTPAGLAFTRSLYVPGGGSELAATVTAVLDLRVDMMRHRLEAAPEAKAFMPIDPYLFTEIVGAPVQMYAMRGYRTFTRELAEQVVKVVLAGLRELSPQAGG